jgi:hypothetical protein
MSNHPQDFLQLLACQAMPANTVPSGLHDQIYNALPQLLGRLPLRRQRFLTPRFLLPLLAYDAGIR